MSKTVKGLLWVLGAIAFFFLFPWRHQALATTLILLAPLAGLWLLMHAMRLEMAIRLTVGVALSFAWIAIFLRMFQIRLPW